MSHARSHLRHALVISQSSALSSAPGGADAQICSQTGHTHASIAVVNVDPGPGVGELADEELVRVAEASVAEEGFLRGDAAQRGGVGAGVVGAPHAVHGRRLDVPQRPGDASIGGRVRVGGGTPRAGSGS